MKKLFYLILFIPSLGLAQNIISVEYETQADIKVYVVEYESQCDLMAFKVEYQSQANGNEGLWFFVEYESQADKKIYFVEYKRQADLKYTLLNIKVKRVGIILKRNICYFKLTIAVFPKKVTNCKGFAVNLKTKAP